MKCLLKLLLFLTNLMVIAPGYSQGTEDVLIRTLKENTFSLGIENGKFTGNGSEVIRKMLQSAQFLLVGEQHGIKEVAEFTKALFSESNPFGFNYLCIETDPYVATKLENLANEGEEAFVHFLTEIPMSFPFYDNRHEFSLIHSAVKLSQSQKPVLWGVDQVFMGAPRLLFSQLIDEAPGKEAAQMVKNYLERAQEGFKEVISTGNPGKLIMNALKEEDFDQLLNAYSPNPGHVALIEKLKESQRIYLLWFNGKQFENNFERSLLMKSQFMDYYNTASERELNPKVVLKFGSTHAYRGLSYYNQFDLGNMVSELAASSGMQSVHFNISGLKGTTQGPFGPPQSFDRSQDIHPMVKSVLDEINDSQWVLMDIRPLRPLIKINESDEVKKLVFGFDFWIFVPEAFPSSRY